MDWIAGRINSVAELRQAERKGDLKVHATKTILNAALVKWSSGNCRLIPISRSISGGASSSRSLTRRASYYWLRILFGPVATWADDPIVGTVQRFTTRIEKIATANSRVILALSLLAVVSVASYIA